MKAAERRWARKPILESDGTISMPCYHSCDLDSEGDANGMDSSTLYARCPFCKTLNNDDHVRLREEYYTKNPKGTCEHFIKMQGGCGAYVFVFKAK